MTDKEINYFRIALNASGFNVDMKNADHIGRIYRLIESHKGQASLQHISQLEAQIERKYEKKKEKPDSAATDHSDE